MSEVKRIKYTRIFTQQIVAGAGYALGLTVGFALFAFLLGQLLNLLGGLPIIGDWFADIISVTQDALKNKK